MANGGIRRDVQGEVPQPLQYEHAATKTCTLMNFLGYGPHIRQARRDAYKACDRYFTALERGKATWITTGSKAEGLTSFLESDMDSIRVRHDVLCIEDGVYPGTIHGETIVLRAYSHMSYPGHCLLLLERYGTTMHTFVYKALCDDGYGRKLLSSNLYINEWLKPEPTEGTVQHERAGPSTPFSHFYGLYQTDIVHALPLYCPSILTRWATRPRNWPSNNVVQEVVSLGAFVTPVGCKGYDYEHVEWRLCFNAGENVLVNNLTDTQLKVYVLLKMVKTDVLKPRKKEVTSFTMKNIVLWMAENNPQSLFDERSLFHWLHEGLYALRVAIDNRKLPYYMIPERNLMAACALEHEQQLTWIATINEMMNEGPRVLLRLPKIRQALIAHPETLRWYSGMKIELELLKLIDITRVSSGIDVQTDVMLHALRRRFWEIVKEVIQMLIMEGCREIIPAKVLHGLLS